MVAPTMPTSQIAMIHSEPLVGRRCAAVISRNLPIGRQRGSPSIRYRLKSERLISLPFFEDQSPKTVSASATQLIGSSTITGQLDGGVIWERMPCTPK